MGRHSPRGARWHVMRMAILERDNWTCRECGARGVRLEVHHIQPVSKRPDLAWSPDNCASVCVPCHLKITDRELGRSAVSLARRQWRQLLRDVPRATEQ